MSMFFSRSEKCAQSAETYIFLSIILDDNPMYLVGKIIMIVFILVDAHFTLIFCD